MAATLPQVTQEAGTNTGREVTGAAAAYRTGSFRALGHEFMVVTSDAALSSYLEALFAPLASDRPAAHTYTLTERPGAGGSDWVLDFDGAEIGRGDPSRALALLLWDVNRSAVQRTRGLVLLHAAAAERDGAAVLLPGAMEVGKTTLVAGLVRAGLGYLTDELTAIDPATGRIRPYPKALSVDPGSYGPLADLEPTVPAAARRFLPDQWQVLPTAIRAGAVASTATPRLVVLPRYVAGQATELRPLSRADALIAVAGCAFTFDDDPAGTLAALGAVLRSCDCYELRSGSLDEAVRTVVDLLDRRLAMTGVTHP